MLAPMLMAGPIKTGNAGSGWRRGVCGFIQGRAKGCQRPIVRALRGRDAIEFFLQRQPQRLGIRRSEQALNKPPRVVQFGRRKTPIARQVTECTGGLVIILQTLEPQRVLTHGISQVVTIVSTQWGWPGQGSAEIAVGKLRKGWRCQ